MQATNRPPRLLHAVLDHELLEALLTEGRRDAELRVFFHASGKCVVLRRLIGFRAPYSMTVLREISAFWTMPSRRINEE